MFATLLLLAAPDPTGALLPVSSGLDRPSGQALTDHYQGALDDAPGKGAVDWTVGLDDVWRLSSFTYAYGGKLHLDLGPSTLVIGHTGDSPDTRAPVWAVVLPDEPAQIRASEPGHGDHVTAAFLRFHPAHLNGLFPDETVTGRGDALALVEAKRQYAHKIGASMQWNNMPVVPSEKFLVFDLDTREGKRRFYMVDDRTHTVRYEPVFSDRALAPLDEEPLEAGRARTIFDEVWGTFDREYAMFGIKPDVDWEALREAYAPAADAAETPYEAAGVVGLLVSHLEDLHVSVQANSGWVWTYQRFRPLNASWRGTKGAIDALVERDGLAYGHTSARLGYVVVWNLQAKDLSDTFDEALEELAGTKGLILDLRFNGGGDETLGRRIAGRFLEDEVVYAKSQYRAGEAHDDLTEAFERKCEPRGPWRYAAPVVVLQGRCTMSSAESLVMMLRGAPNVTTFGAPTAGSSGNPRFVEPGAGIRVRMPRWIDLDANGAPIDGVGVAPDEPQDEDLQPGDFLGDEDIVFEDAVKWLKKRAKGKPGKRE